MLKKAWTINNGIIMLMGLLCVYQRKPNMAKDGYMRELFLKVLICVECQCQR